MFTDHPSIAQAAAGRRIIGPLASEAGVRLGRLGELICGDADRAAQMVVAGFWLTLGSGLHRASRHPGGYAGPVDPTEEGLRWRMMTAAGRDSQFHQSLVRLVRSHLTGG